ncbi:MAG: hypothetical protein GTN43_03625 [Candidatus Aenigmarchaeota archaeon]|nr:hypothetical protein [Candidatus Aenigmarchaeota archaeon]
MIIVYADDSWRVIGQNSQMAAIKHEDGVEKMIIAVQTDYRNTTGTKSVWIFPVPGDPEQMELDVLEKLPTLGGRNVTTQAKNDLTTSLSLISFSQVYNFFVLLLSSPGYYTSGLGPETYGKLGVEVFERVEKFGVTTELIGADDSESFNNYISGKGLSFSGESKDLIDEYIGKDYSFVLFWISDLEEFKNHTISESMWSMRMFTNIGVYVSFPSERIYYPMKLTSAYGGKTIPVQLYIIGYAEPEFYDEIKNSKESWLSVSHLFQKNYEIPEELEKFFGQSGTVNFVYTDVKMHVPANLFVEDFWIEPKGDEEYFSKYQTPIFISVNIQWISILWLLIISAVSSVLAGFIIFWDQKPKIKVFSLLGLSNIFSLIAFAIASCKVLGPEDKKEVKKQNTTKRRLIFLLIVIVYLSLVNIFFIYLPSQFRYFYFFETLPFVLTFLVLPPALFFAFGHSKRPQTTKFILVFTILFTVLNYFVYAGLLSLI